MQKFLCLFLPFRLACASYKFDILINMFSVYLICILYTLFTWWSTVNYHNISVYNYSFMHVIQIVAQWAISCEILIKIPCSIPKISQLNSIKPFIFPAKMYLFISTISFGIRRLQIRYFNAHIFRFSHFPTSLYYIYIMTHIKAMCN